jgi:hypothetical protein
MSGYTGSGSSFDILRLRRMTAITGSAEYTDAMLQDTIRRYPVDDADGVSPPAGDGYAPSASGWTATYDMALAAAEIWEEKSAAIASNFAFDADGASFQKQQQYEHYVAQARLWKGRRVAGVWIAETVRSTSTSQSWIGNVNDPYE